MSKICIVETANTFGALKLIEQLYMDGEIPGHVFRNIIKQYGSSFPVTKFSCYKEEEPPDTEGEKTCMD